MGSEWAQVGFHVILKLQPGTHDLLVAPIITAPCPESSKVTECRAQLSTESLPVLSFIILTQIFISLIPFELVFINGTR